MSQNDIWGEVLWATLTSFHFSILFPSVELGWWSCELGMLYYPVQLSRNSVCFLFMIFLSTDEIASNLKPFILTICRSHKYHGLVWKSSSPKTGSVSGKKEFWVSHKIGPKDKSYVKHRKHFWDSHKTESRHKGFVKYRKGFWVSHKIEPRQRWKLCKIQKTFLRFTEYKTKT